MRCMIMICRDLSRETAGAVFAQRPGKVTGAVRVDKICGLSSTPITQVCVSWVHTDLAPNRALPVLE